MFVVDSVDIYAPQTTVWNALVGERIHYRTRIESNIGMTYVMHQQFETPLGPAKVTFLMVDRPFSKMDFLLTESDEVKELKGQWNLIPCNNNKTKLELCVEKLKTKIPVPDWLLKKVFMKISHKRLLRIKEISESK